MSDPYTKEEMEERLELEKKCRETAALCEEQWTNAGKKVGLEIWRIENFEVKPIDKEDYGSFYEGDSYIIMNTYKKGDGDALAHDIHFWLGSETSHDERGTAAYKTVELDDVLGGHPVQHRETEKHESERFLSYFKNGVRILNGGIASGFTHVTPEEYTARLLHLKGTFKSMRITQVPLSTESLNSGDVFILDNGLHLYQFQGANTSGSERIKAAALCRQIDDERSGEVEVYVLDESDDCDKAQEFWDLLGGKAEIKSAEEGGCDKHAASVAHADKKLFRLSHASGRLEMTLEATNDLDRSSLDTNDVFIVDNGVEVYVWIGEGAAHEERKHGIEYAERYLKEYQRPLWTPISQVLEGGENPVFEGMFN